MTDNKKTNPEAYREAGYDIAFDSHNHSPIHSRLTALLIWFSAYDAAVIAVLFLIVRGAMV